MLGLRIQGLGFRVWEGVSSYNRLYKGSTRVPCPGKATVIETCDGVLEVQGASMCSLCSVCSLELGKDLKAVERRTTSNSNSNGHPKPL